MLICFSLLVGCGESRDPQTPEGALRLFGAALSEGDRSQIKTSLSEKTHTQLGQLLVLLKRINEAIAGFPTPEAQAWARQEALGDQLQQVEAITDVDVLFSRLFREKLEWAQNQPSGEVEQGLSARRVTQGSLEGGEITLLTRSESQVAMRREGSRWVITTFEEPLDRYVKAMERSLTALAENKDEWERRVRQNLKLPTVQDSSSKQK